MPESTGVLRGARLHLAVGALALGGVGIGVTEFAMMGLLQEASADLGISIPQAGHLITAYALGVVIGAPTITILAARVNRRRLAIWLAASLLLASLLCWVAPSYELLFLGRLLAGLPHGAYFGVAGVIAANLAGPELRGRAVAAVLLGLSVSNLLMVPAVTWLGQNIGWRSMFAAVALLAALTVVSVIALVPRTVGDPDASVRRELSGLRNRGLWLAVLTGMIGFGGFFAVYSYISPIMTEITGIPLAAVPLVLSVYGLGMVVGNVIGGRLADWSVTRTVYLAMIFIIAMQLLFFVLAPHPVPAIIMVFVLGSAGSMLIPSLQSLMMDAAPRASTLAAALNHSALNMANALGAYLGGVAIAIGWGLRSTTLIGAGLATLGLIAAVFAVYAITNPASLRRRA